MSDWTQFINVLTGNHPEEPVEEAEALYDEDSLILS
jgi:hypothetical protein